MLMPNKTNTDSTTELESLRARLEEAEETLRAIREGEVDAFVVSSPKGEDVRTLKGTEHLPRLILQEMTEGVVALSHDHIVYANHCFTHMTGAAKESNLNRPIKDFILPAEHLRFDSLLEKARDHSVKDEFMVINRDGGHFPACITFNFLETEGLSCHCLILSDLTELKRAQNEILAAKAHLEERVLERTQELAVTNENLARSNSELEQFAYVSSHDLQEPLRTISVYVDLFNKSYAGNVDPRGRQFLDFIQEGSQRARGLIQALLSYARIGTNGAPIDQPANMERVLDIALANLKALIEESKAVITRDPLATVQANDTEITQLLQNLISNALKYRGERVPIIHVSAKNEGKAWVFSVKDNGIGIDNQYLDYIFLIFKRLHDRSVYPGAGIGLSVCKKIVERHGGEIWVESKPGEGSTFYFSIPNRTPNISLK